MSASAADSTGPGRCLVCPGLAVPLYDFGPQPLTNRLPSQPAESIPAHPLILGACDACGLVQVTAPPPPDLLRPPEAVLYREPEGHLDALVADVLTRIKDPPALRPWGLTYKDASTVERFRARGCRQPLLLDPAADWGVTDSAAGLETIQAAVDAARTASLRDRHGACDLLVARHVLEHAQQTGAFLNALAALLAPEGCLLIEVPDCSAALSRCDYTMLWEEHVAYFTPATLRDTLSRCSFQVDALHVYPDPDESSLVAVARPRAETAEPFSHDTAAAADGLVRRYTARFPQAQAQWRQHLQRLRETHGGVALFGAGHRAVSFLHLLELTDLVDLVVDDSDDKQGRYLPGTQLQIAAPAVLEARPEMACLLAVRSEYESRVVVRYGQGREHDGRLCSIYPSSRYAAPWLLVEGPA